MSQYIDGNGNWWLYGKFHRYYGPTNWGRYWYIHGVYIRARFNTGVVIND